MKYDDVEVGGEVIIGGKMADSFPTLMALFGVKAKVIGKIGPVEGNETYPFGMVALELPEKTQWSTREVYIGPEDLAKVPDANTTS